MHRLCSPSQVMRDWSAAFIVDLGPATVEDIKGEGVGATRTVCFPGPDGSIAKWGERVSAFDEGGMTWSYVLTSELPFPLDITTFVMFHAACLWLGMRFDRLIRTVERDDSATAFLGGVPFHASCGEQGITCQF